MQLDRLSVDTTQRTCMTKARQIGGLPPSEKTGSGLGRPFAPVRFGPDLLRSAKDFSYAAVAHDT